jgi:DNA-binding CsgD family transcriptional regulator
MSVLSVRDCQPVHQSVTDAGLIPAVSDPAVQTAALSHDQGLVLTTLSFEPIYTNRSAVLILGYPDHQVATSDGIRRRIRNILQSENMIAGAQPTSFLSGRRRYTCQSFLMESRADASNSPVVALLLDRRPRDPVGVSDIRRRFRLSSRESETVRHLVEGRSTKEVAQCMGVSPNTVKQFIRLAMTKMGVSNRTGIVGKVLSH